MISIIVSGDWIYYVIHEVQGVNKGIYRIRKDGTQRTKLSDSATQQITVDDNGIYFVDVQIEKSALDATMPNIIYQPVGIKRMNLDGTNETSIYTGSVSQDLQVLKNEITMRLDPSEYNNSNSLSSLPSEGSRISLTMHSNPNSSACGSIHVY